MTWKALVAAALVLAAGELWLRRDVGRYVYMEVSDSPTVMDTRTGTLYTFIPDEKHPFWREVHPQTGVYLERGTRYPK